MENILKLAINWSEQSEVALATVIQTWGSAPRPVGSMMIIKDYGIFEGSVSGGCIEGAVIHAGAKVIKTGKSQVLNFGVSNDDAISVGLACGGTIKVLVEKIDSEMREQIKAIQTSLKHKKTIIWLKPLAGDGGCKLLSPEQLQSLKEKNGHNENGHNEDVFYHTFTPPLKLAIIGAVHIAQALAPMAELSGFEVEIIDPRGAFAEAERMKNCTINENWPDDALMANMPDSSTALVTLTHDPKLDDAALKVALDSKAFYIGCLGSKKTHEKRLERLGEQGFNKEQLSRIHGPVGLDIGAKSASEIAVSILAEIIARHRKPS